VALVAAAALLAGFTFLEAMFAPKAKLWPRWQASDAALQAQLLTPATEALQKRAQLREEISAFKSEHKLS